MFDTILFAYDGSAEGREALEEGLALAIRVQARCFLLAVIPPPPAITLAEDPVSAELLDRDRTSTNQILGEAITRMRGEGVDATAFLRVDEDPSTAIAEFADHVDADLIVIGHHRRSALKRWWHGSIGHSLLDRVSCSVLVSMSRKRNS